MNARCSHARKIRTGKCRLPLTPFAPSPQHEWLKHGTCAAELPSIGDEQDYFALGLRWSAAYQPLHVLATSGVRPGADAYRWTQIRDALTAHFSTRMIVDCEMDRVGRGCGLGRREGVCLKAELGNGWRMRKKEDLSTKRAM